MNAPVARFDHVAVWTGSEMILVWGGCGAATGCIGTHLASGGRYDPTKDTWTAMTSTGAPAARSNATAVWTGSEMIVWGGNNSAVLGSGGRYDPEQRGVGSGAEQRRAVCPHRPHRRVDRDADARLGRDHGRRDRLRHGRRLHAQHRRLVRSAARERADAALLPHGRLDRQRDDCVGGGDRQWCDLHRRTLLPYRGAGARSAPLPSAEPRGDGPAISTIALRDASTTPSRSAKPWHRPRSSRNSAATPASRRRST